MPTEKSKEIDDLLTYIAGIRRQEAAAASICTVCKKPLTPFRDSLSRREYEISGLCQECQDSVFGTGEEGFEDY
jgi:hypothetical protein